MFRFVSKRQASSQPGITSPRRAASAVLASALTLGALQAGAALPVASAQDAAPAAPTTTAAPAAAPQPAPTLSPADPNLPGSVLLAQRIPVEPGFPLPETLPGVYNPNDPFYLRPADMPSKPGSLIRTQPAPQLLNSFANGGPGSAQKILYTSINKDGRAVPVSGFVLEPAVPWTGGGPVPTIVMAPGTRGQADVCAPSRGAALIAGLNPNNLSLNINYELPVMYAASAMGMRVVATDLIGLGTEGVHTFADTIDEGHAVIDAARAGLAAAGAPADAPVGFYGYSQGGGASAAGAELAGTYAPELNLKGTYAGAPPSNLYDVTKSVDGNLIMGVLGYALNGQLEHYPGMASIVDEEFNEDGKRYLKETKERCIPDTVLAYGLTDSRRLTRTGESFNQILDRRADLREILGSQQLGKRKLNAPMMVANGVYDDTIPFQQARVMAKNYCGLGGTVEFVSSDIPSLIPKSALNHGFSLFERTPAALQYMVDRFSNRPAPSNCSSL